MRAKWEESPATLLCERHARPMLAYLRRHAPSWEDAEDVLQEVYLRFVGGLRCPQIAVLLGKREDAIRKRLSRAVTQLRQFYQQR